jgi:NADH-quinone oxidoreductase subunit E
MDLTQVDQIIDNYHADGAWLVMILQDVQEACNYLPAEALERVAEKLSLGLGHVYNVATFYSSFSLTERGRHVIRVCDGTACHIRGSVSVLDEIQRQLGIEDGQTTEDGAFTLESVACLGACALAPVMTVGSKYYGKLTPEKLKDILDAHRQEVSANA